MDFTKDNFEPTTPYYQSSLKNRYKQYRNNYRNRPINRKPYSQRYQRVENYRYPTIKKFKRKETKKKQKPSRPQSPLVGTEEHSLKQIEETSKMIQLQLLNPHLFSEKEKTPESNNVEENQTEEVKEQQKQKEKSVKTKKNQNSTYNLHDIHNKIIDHISNMSHAKKKSLICSSSSELDSAIQLIQKQKRLELSKALRDMCSNQNHENVEIINSIIPDMDIKIEQLPVSFLRELCENLDMTMDDFQPQSSNDQMQAKIWIKDEFNENTIDITKIVPDNCEFFDDISNIVVNIPENLQETGNLNVEQSNDKVDENLFLNNQTIKQEPVDQPCYEVSEPSEQENEIIDIPSNSVNQEQNISEKNPENCTQSPLTDNKMLPEPPPEIIAIKKETIEIESILDNRPQNSIVQQSETIETSPQINNIETNAIIVPGNLNIPEQNICNCSLDKRQTSSIETQTDLSLSILKSDINEVDLMDISTLDDALKSMYEIDNEIARLTKLRQMIFVNLNKNKSSGKNNINNNSNKRSSKRLNATESNKTSKKLKVQGRSSDQQNEAAVDNLNNQCVADNKAEYQFEKQLNLGKLNDKILTIKVLDSVVLAGANTGNLYVINLIRDKIIRKIKVARKPIISISNYNSTRIFVGSQEHKFWEYNSKYKFVNEKCLKSAAQCMEINWNYLFMGTCDGHLIRYSLTKNKIEYEDVISNSSVLVLKATQEGARKVLLIGTRNTDVYIRCALTGLHLRTMEKVLSPTVYSLVLDDSLVYCGTTSHDILVYQFHDGSLVRKYKSTNSKAISCLKIVNNLLFASCYDGDIYIYDKKTDHHVGKLQGPGGIVVAMEIVGNLILISTLKLKFTSIIIPKSILDYKSC